jgi:hypothetical protein
VRSAAGGSRQPEGCHQGCRAGVLHGPWALASVRSRTSNSCARVHGGAQESVQETASDGQQAGTHCSARGGSLANRESHIRHRAERRKCPPTEQSAWRLFSLNGTPRSAWVVIGSVR